MDFDLLTTSEAAKLLKVAKKTLEKWRSEGSFNLPYITVGGSIKYDKQDIVNYLKDNTKRS